MPIENLSVSPADLRAAFAVCSAHTVPLLVKAGTGVDVASRRALFKSAVEHIARQNLPPGADPEDARIEVWWWLLNVPADVSLETVTLARDRRVDGHVATAACYVYAASASQMRWEHEGGILHRALVLRRALRIAAEATPSLGEVDSSAFVREAEALVRETAPTLAYSAGVVAAQVVLLCLLFPDALWMSAVTVGGGLLLIYGAQRRLSSLRKCVQAHDDVCVGVLERVRVPPPGAAP